MTISSFPSKRAPIYQDVPDEKWSNWRWQLSNRLNTAEEFDKIISLTDSERQALNSPALFRVDITPYFISLIDPNDPLDPIRKQVIPTSAPISWRRTMMCSCWTRRAAFRCSWLNSTAQYGLRALNPTP